MMCRNKAKRRSFDFLYKFMNQSRPHTTDKESGVTLLLSLLILSAITAIAFSLATIMFIEIRSSGDLQRTEPALFATQGILEEAIFKIKRNVSEIPETGCATNLFALDCTVNGVSVQTTIDSYREPVLNESILSTATDYIVTKHAYYLINPDDPYSDVDGNGSPDGGYARLILTNTGSGAQANLEVAICRIDDSDCINTNGTFTPGIEDIGPDPLPIGQTIIYDSSDGLVATSAYALYIINKTPGSGGFIHIESYGPLATQALGLPYFGKKAIDVQATYIGLTRKYRAIVPTQ
jgi:hypothetical protein